MSFKSYKYENSRDLLRFLSDVCKTNINIDWNEKEDKANKEFEFIYFTINNFLNNKKSQ